MKRAKATNWHIARCPAGFGRSRSRWGLCYLATKGSLKELLNVPSPDRSPFPGPGAEVSLTTLPARKEMRALLDYSLHVGWEPGGGQRL